MGADSKNKHRSIVGKKYTVKEISGKEARAIVKLYHYSGKCVTNSNIHLGVYLLGRLVGCLQFGPPMNGKKTISKLKCGNDLVELNRMVMDDEQPRNSESQAISLCLKYIKKHTSIECVLSFSDGKEGNVGYIYQATNWKYIGYMLSSSFYDLDGDIVHAITVWHRYKEKHADRYIKTTNEIVCDNFNSVSIITSKQHIYLFDVKKNASSFWDAKEYPKKDKEARVVKRKVLKENGATCSRVMTYVDEKLSPAY
ncbi:MAG: hypothetical protein GY928_16320 [Colwellia sp.]|nr:hypothetical protein [Colwellia sp.]